MKTIHDTSRKSKVSLQLGSGLIPTDAYMRNLHYWITNLATSYSTQFWGIQSSLCFNTWSRAPPSPHLFRGHPSTKKTCAVYHKNSPFEFISRKQKQGDIGECTTFRLLLSLSTTFSMNKAAMQACSSPHFCQAIMFTNQKISNSIKRVHILLSTMNCFLKWPTGIHGYNLLNKAPAPQASEKASVQASMVTIFWTRHQHHKHQYQRH